MKTNVTPLTDLETIELRQLLEAAGGASLEYAHGVFAAVATAPTRKDVTDWLPFIIGDQLPDTTQLKRLFALLMRDFQACEECLSLSVPAVPAPSDVEAITRYCKGYVRVAHADARWKGDMEAFALTIPFAVLSGYIAPASLSALQPELAADPDAWCAKQRDDLASSAATLYAYWTSARERGSAPAQGKGKVGRNEPCPCQSGKKFKKCCGAS